MRTLGIGGLSVTMPHKEDVAAAVDELAPAAAALRSVNTVVARRRRPARRPQHRRRRLRRLAGRRRRRRRRRPRRRLGAGAAARSVVDALGRAGAADIAVVNRTRGRAAEAAALAGGRPRRRRSTTWPRADVVVNATSVGMGTDELPLDPALLRPGQVVADLVYHPLRDGAAAAPPRRPAAARVDGLGMLVHQAVLQQELWTGARPDPAVMRAAAESELARR